MLNDDDISMMECGNSACRKPIMNPNEHYCVGCRTMIKVHMPYYILVGSVIGALIMTVICSLTHSQ